MKLSARLSALILCLAAASAWAVNNNDIIKMTKAGLDEATITAAVRGASPAEFDTSPDALIKLKEAGVKQPVIQAMIEKQSGGSAAASPAAGPAPSISSNKVDDAKVLPPTIDPVEGKEYYTRYGFQHEKGRHITTNYGRGELAPINSKVVLVKMKKGDYTLRFVDGGQEVTIVNEEKFTNRGIKDIAREMLAEKPTAIDLYGKEMADAIRTGTMRLGMTKTQVLLTRGYPPRHETPSLDGDRWIYWSNRFAKHTLVFTDGILREGRGIH